jgi:hypothetical protein
MRYARQQIVSIRWVPAMLPLLAALVTGCRGQVEGVGPTGAGNNTGTAGTKGAAGSIGGDAPCAGASDPRTVVAQQRITLLTSWEMANTVTYLINEDVAQQVVSAGFNLTPDSMRHFPPTDGEVSTIIGTGIQPIRNMADAVGTYVSANFGAVTGCTTATDSCATGYLNKLAGKAYRRQLTSAEQQRFTDLYNNLKQQMVNGYMVTTTVQDATGYVVDALLMSPQLLWRWELGSAPSTSPPGVYLTDTELASELSFFMTDQPPDDMLLASANAGTLRANLASQFSRLLQTTTSKNWLRHVMELYFLLNALPQSPVDPGKFTDFTGPMISDMQTEEQMFLDNVLWNGKLEDLLQSRDTFVNTGLAQSIYKVEAPGATATTFVKVTLPSDERTGILTNAAFLASRGRSDGQGLIIPRGKAIKAIFMCTNTPGPPDNIKAQIDAASAKFSEQTGQQQAAFRAMTSPCSSCHPNFDPYGLVLEFYDTIGRYRTNYDYLSGMPAIDGHATLPAELGGTVVNNAVDLANALTNSPTFVNCMATQMLQYAMTTLDAAVDAPLPGQPGCAAADVVQRYQSAGSKTFPALLTAVTQSPAFTIRQMAQ